MHLSRSMLALLGSVMLGSVVLNIWLYLRPQVSREEITSESSDSSRPSLPNRPRPANLGDLSEKSRSDKLHRAIKSSSGRDEILRQFLAWAENDPAAALKWAEKNTEGDMNRELTLLGLKSWAEANPAAASEWVDLLPQGTRREQAVTSVIATWGLTDGRSAAAWLDTLSEGSLKISDESQLAAADSLASAWASHQPASAVDWAQDFVTKHEGSAALHLSLASFGSSDPTAAKAYYNAITHEETRAIAAESIGRGMATTHPKDALAWALELGKGEPGWLARNSVFNQWSLNQPSEVAGNISSITDTEERTHHISTLMTNWTASDANAAEQWTMNLPPSIDKDHAIKGLAENYAPASPDKALNLSLTIANPDLRLQVTEGILSWWREENRAQADEWFTETPIDPKLKTALSGLESDDSE